ALVDIGALDEALAAVDEGMDLCRSAGPQQARCEDDQLLARAAALLEKGRPGEALLLLQRQLRAQGDSPAGPPVRLDMDLLATRAVIAMGRASEAARAANDAVSFARKMAAGQPRPTLVRALTAQGEAALSSGHDREALGALEEAMKGEGLVTHPVDHGD